MIKHKWICEVRNKLESFYEQCDSAAAIDGAMMSEKEREELQELLAAPYNYINKKIGTIR